VRALFEQALLRNCRKEGWLVEVDGAAQEAVLVSGGALLDGFRGGADVEHTIRVITQSGQVAEWKIRFGLETVRQN
jgi:hypothetical protein